MSMVLYEMHLFEVVGEREKKKKWVEGHSMAVYMTQMEWYFLSYTMVHSMLIVSCSLVVFPKFVVVVSWCFHLFSFRNMPLTLDHSIYLNRGQSAMCHGRTTSGQNATMCCIARKEKQGKDSGYYEFMLFVASVVM